MKPFSLNSNNFFNGLIILLSCSLIKIGLNEIANNKIDWPNATGFLKTDQRKAFKFILISIFTLGISKGQSELILVNF